MTLAMWPLRSRTVSPSPPWDLRSAAFSTGLSSGFCTAYLTILRSILMVILVIPDSAPALPASALSRKERANSHAYCTARRVVEGVVAALAQCQQIPHFVLPLRKALERPDVVCIQLPALLATAAAGGFVPLETTFPGNLHVQRRTQTHVHSRDTALPVPALFPEIRLTQFLARKQCRTAAWRNSCQAQPRTNRHTGNAHAACDLDCRLSR